VSLLGMKVIETSMLPGDMVVMCRNGEVMHRFIWTANALADQELEIEALRARAAALEAERDELLAPSESDIWRQWKAAEERLAAATALARRRGEALDDAVPVIEGFVKRTQKTIASVLNDVGCDGDLCSRAWHEDLRRIRGDLDDLEATAAAYRAALSEDEGGRREG
jgi:hypothetical protein